MGGHKQGNAKEPGEERVGRCTKSDLMARLLTIIKGLVCSKGCSASGWGEV